MSALRSPSDAGGDALDRLQTDRARASDPWRAAVYVAGRLVDARDPDAIRAAATDASRYVEAIRGSIGSGPLAEEELGRLTGAVALLLVEAGPPAAESAGLDGAGFAELRRRLAFVLESLLDVPAYSGDRERLRRSVVPLLHRTAERGYAYRINDASAAFDALYDVALASQDPPARARLIELYRYKYARFGTSGIRGVWGRDITAPRVRSVAKAVGEQLTKGRPTPGRSLVVGYDSRPHADEIALWVTDVLVRDGFRVHLTSRDSPTPAINFQATVPLAGQVDGILTITASHNPPEWHGIKFTLGSGEPAPANVTNGVGARASQLLFEDSTPGGASLGELVAGGRVQPFDPEEAYCRWVLEKPAGSGLDLAAIRSWFADKQVVVDEMYGAGRGYLRRALGALGVPFAVVHGVPTPSFGRLLYPLPEEPHLADCQEATRSLGAAVGLAMDGDADRFGVVGTDGRFFTANEVLPMLVAHLLKRGRRGKVIRSFTASRLIDQVVEAYGRDGQVTRPRADALPAYARHPLYRATVGAREFVAGSPSYVVMVGMKNLAEAASMDADYRVVPAAPERTGFILAGEDSGGLTTGAHLFDKDAIWADLLVLDILAAYRGSVQEVWDGLQAELGTSWSYGRLDLDGTEATKQGLVDHYLLSLPAAHPAGLAGLEAEYVGGIPGDFAEVYLRGHGVSARVIVRASGTEPLCRVYTESSSESHRQAIEREVLGNLDRLASGEISRAQDAFDLVELLLVTPVLPGTLRAAQGALAHLDAGSGGKASSALLQGLRSRLPSLETRKRLAAEGWIPVLSAS